MNPPPPLTVSLCLLSKPSGSRCDWSVLNLVCLIGFLGVMRPSLNDRGAHYENQSGRIITDDGFEGIRYTSQTNFYPGKTSRGMRKKKRQCGGRDVELRIWGLGKDFKKYKNVGKEGVVQRRSWNLDGKPTGVICPSRACDPEQ